MSFDSDWQPGDHPELGDYWQVDPDSLRKSELYRLMTDVIIPRPIALISTQDGRGRCNLAPFSYFNGVSTAPPCVSVAIARRRGGEKKDTLRNIEETRQFVVNITSEWLALPMAFCAAEHSEEIDELAEAGLTALESVKVAPPRVKEAAVQLECEFYDSLQIGDGSPGSSDLVVGRILMFHIADAVRSAQGAAAESIRPLARFGGIRYGRLGELFDIKIPKPEST